MNSKLMSKKSIFTIGLLTFCMLFGVFASAALAQQRIIVLPFYIENGRDANQGGVSTMHKRVSFYNKI